jgi:hypothetical protein
LEENMGVFGVKFDGIGANAISFLSALTRGTDEGKVVKITDNGTVALCSAADQFDGVVKVIDKADKVASVQTKGMVTVAYTGTAPSVGRATLEANATGGVQIVGTPVLGDRFYQIVSVDTTAGTVTFDLG